MANWRKQIDPLLKDHLELQIKESYKQKKAYSKALNTSKAQLWVAIANLSKQDFDLNLRLKVLEKKFNELSKIKSKKKNIKKLKKY